ncbi:MAG TPA: NAD(P)/FAD-dependent oxidoreductase [Gammaproteobacteria bacterium]|nr:NAD(P)/FAD-dependent oxidoreductase [Gammaproteobacteria bacterium]
MIKQQVEFLVIGGGPGGTPAAMALAAAGKSVMLVEKGPGPGGTCLFEGCIPSKILRESARRLRELKQAGQFGLCLPTQDVTINWSAILERKRAILKQRSEAAVQKIEQLPTLKMISGVCQLSGSRSAIIKTQAGETLDVQFEKAILSTGSRPFIPPIKGHEHPRVHDSESILSIDHIPQRLLIIGGGPIGVELGQIFNTLGSEVSILETASRILGPADEELSNRLQQRMQDDGIDILTDCKVRAILTTGQNVFVEYTLADGTEQHRLADTVLMVTGRRPEIDGLGLENTNVQHETQGITVSDKLETTEAGIYAVGDVIGQPMFAHWATAQGLALARHLMGQAVVFPTVETNSAVIFSEPEMGIAGLNEQQAKQAGLNVQVARYDYMQDARAQITGSADGLLKIIFDVDSRQVVGVQILVEGAGDLMGEAALLIKTGVPIDAIAAAIHPHPTLTESFAMAVRNAMAQVIK